MRSILSFVQRNCTCAFDWASYCETTSDSLRKQFALPHFLSSSSAQQHAPTHPCTTTQRTRPRVAMLSLFGASCSEWNRAARCREAWKNFRKKKKAHPTLQALVKIDLAANTNSSTRSGRFGLRRCPRRNGYANEQGRIEHSCDCQGYVFFARSSHHDKDHQSLLL